MYIHNEKIIKWLLDGDVSLQYQVHRDLLNDGRQDLRERIQKENSASHSVSAERLCCTKAHYARFVAGKRPPGTRVP